MQRQQKEIVATMLIKYIMSMSGTDCKFQEEKRNKGKVFILVVIPFCIHMHHQYIVGMEMYVMWRNKKVFAQK